MTTMGYSINRKRYVLVILFLSFLILSINAVIIQTVIIDDELVKNIMRFLALSGFSSAIILMKKKANSLLYLLLIFQILLLILTQNRDIITSLYLIIIMISVWHVSERSLLKLLMISSIVSFSMIFIFLFLGLTENHIIEYRNRMTYGISGKGSVTFFYNLVYGLFTLYLIFNERYKRNKLIILKLLIIALSTYFYIKTDNRAGYGLTLIFIAFTICLPYFARLRLFKIIIALMPVIMLSLMYIVAHALSDTIYNEILSNRAVLYEAFLRNISFLEYLTGTSVKAFDDISIVDNSYVHILFGNGFIFFTLYMVLHYKAINHLFELRRYYQIAFIISTSGYFFMESLAVRIEMMFVIYYWYLIFSYGLRVSYIKTDQGSKYFRRLHNTHVHKRYYSLIHKF